jgi:hypothetical protein
MNALSRFILLSAVFIAASLRGETLDLIPEDFSIAKQLKFNDVVLTKQKTWWQKHYVRGLGLAPFDTGIIAVPKPYAPADQGGSKSNRNEVLVAGFDSNGNNKILTESEFADYALADVIPGRSEDSTHKNDLDTVPFPFPLIFFRIQDDITSKPMDSEPGTFLWENDQNANRQSTMLNAALITDMYFAGVGGFGRYSSEGMFHLQLAIEAERFDSGKTTPDIDIRRYSAFAEFSPGGLLGIRSIRKDHPRQLMTIGWTYEDDMVADVQRNSFQLKYTPSFNLPGSFLDMFVGERSFFDGLFQFFDPEKLKKREGAIATASDQSETQGQKADKALSKAEQLSRERMNGLRSQTAPLMSKQEFKHFFYLRPNVGLDYGDASISSVLRTGIPDLNLLYTVETGLSFFHEAVHFGYRLTGYTGLSEGRTNVGHEFFVRAAPSGWPVQMFATYRQGKIAPSFTSVDVVQIGVGVKF